MCMMCITAYSAEATFLSTVRNSPGFLERYDKNSVRWGISGSIGDCPEKQENTACPSFRIFTDGRKKWDKESQLQCGVLAILCLGKNSNNIFK